MLAFLATDELDETVEVAVMYCRECAKRSGLLEECEC
jgi:hypothetical protein